MSINKSIIQNHIIMKKTLNIISYSILAGLLCDKVDTLTTGSFFTDKELHQHEKKNGNGWLKLGELFMVGSMEYDANELIDENKYISLTMLQAQIFDKYQISADDSKKHFYHFIIDRQYRSNKYIDKLTNHGIDSWIFS